MKINLCNPGYKFKIANKCLLKKSEMTQNDVKENEILENPNSCYNRQLIELQFSGIKKNKQPTLIERSKGCLHGGAAGDALGAKLEWLSVENIKKIYGESGLRYIPKRNGEYRITDDTQMTLFTSEGLLNSFLKTLDIECEPNYNDIYNSYLNWYTTQIEESPKDFCSSKLLQDKAFYSPRFPGKTCLEALKNKTMGTLDEPINDSMGNGGIMRVAPIGIMYNSNPELAFKIGVKSAALTHGHPNAYLPAGFLASLIANLINNISLEDSIRNSIDILKTYKGYQDTLECVKKAMIFSNTDKCPEDAIRNIGYGGRGDEALGIALYSVLKNPTNFKKALVTAVNHDGDSDSTGSIAGNIMGALVGVSGIPRNWVENIEHVQWLNAFSEALCINTSDFALQKESCENLQKRRDDDRLTETST